MGISLSTDHSISTGKNQQKCLMLLAYENESLKSISLIDFISNPLMFSSYPMILLEPSIGCSAPIVKPSIKGISYIDTMRVFHQTYRLDLFQLGSHTLWFFSSSKLSSSIINEAKCFIRKAPLSNFISTSSVDPFAIFSDLGGVSTIRDALKPPNGNPNRASSPIRAAGQFCGITNYRRSHNLGINAAYIVPQFQSADIMMTKMDDDLNYITNGVFIGGERAASNIDGLKKNQISHIINLSGSTTKNVFPNDFKYFTISLSDRDFEDLTEDFWNALAFLKESVSSGKTTLVHCRRGICRSAALVVAYLQDTQLMNVESAYSYIKSKRSSINITQSFLDQLYKRDEKIQKPIQKLLP